MMQLLNAITAAGRTSKQLVYKFEDEKFEYYHAGSITSESSLRKNISDIVSYHLFIWLKLARA